MIVHKHKFVFVHIPKTAGTSINHALLTSLTGRATSGSMASLSSPLREEYGLTGPLKHGTAFELQHRITKKQWDGYYKAAFVRNPWDRTVSAYHWATKYEGFSSITFNDYVNLVSTCREDTDHPLQILLRPQISFIMDANGTNILDDIFQFEQLPAGLKQIGSRIGLNLNKIIKKQNTTKKRKPYQSYYTPNTQSTIQECYENDIQLFNYEF